MAQKSKFTITAVGFWGAIAMLAWVVAAISSYTQKSDADQLIRDSADISAVQIQQLNGSVTSHAVVALVIAMMLTMPLMIAALSAIVSRDNAESDAEVTATPPTPKPAAAAAAAAATDGTY